MKNDENENETKTKKQKTIENEKIENENGKIEKLVTQRKCQHTIRRSIRCADVM